MRFILIGGEGSKAESMNQCKGNVEILNIAYSDAPARVSEIVEEIDSHPEVRYVVAGHSSGARYSNEIGFKVKDPQNLTIISLDGFHPKKIKGRVDTACWSANNGRGLVSKNAFSMTAENCGRVRSFSAPHCETAWCLHFSLVNLVAPKRLNGKTFRAMGYRNCLANSQWTGILQ